MWLLDNPPWHSKVQRGHAMPIIRLFRVRIHPEMQDEFEEKFASVSIAAVEQAPGSLGVEIFKPSQWAPREYLMISRWRDEAALKSFAGDSWNNPFIPAGMERYVADCRIAHFTSWEDR